MSHTRSVSLIGLLTAAGLLASLASLTAFLGSFWWIFELTSHFRVQYALALIIFAITLLWLRQWRVAAALAGVALLNLAVIAPAFWPDARAASMIRAGQPSLRALLANVNLDNLDHDRIRRLIADAHPDVMVLLEISPELIERLGDLRKAYPHQVAELRDDPFGIVVLSRHPLSATQIIPLGESGPPAIVAVATVGNRAFTVIGAHPWPPISAAFAQGRNRQLAEVAHLARQIQTPLLVMGDLNTSPWSPYFARLLADSGLHDSRRGHGIQPSWPVGLPPLWTPIDHILFSSGIRILRRQTGTAMGSDHYPVIVEFQITDS